MITHTSNQIRHITSHLTTVCFILFIVNWFTACDPGYEEHVLLVNGSTHTVTIIPSNWNHYDDYLDTTFVYHNSTYRLLPGEEVQVWSDGGLGYASIDNAERGMKHYLGDSVIFCFEDSLQAVFHANDTTAASPYNFHSIHYRFEEKSKPRNSHPFYGKLTFTVTDDHHSIAK